MSLLRPWISPELLQAGPSTSLSQGTEGLAQSGYPVYICRLATETECPQGWLSSKLAKVGLSWPLGPCAHLQGRGAPEILQS